MSPHCREIIAGDESLYGRESVPESVRQRLLFVPPAPSAQGLRTARLISGPPSPLPVVRCEHPGNRHLQTVSGRAYLPGQIPSRTDFHWFGRGLAIRAQDFLAALGGAGPVWSRCAPAAAGLDQGEVLQLSLDHSTAIRPSRLVGKHVNELELYRVKDRGGGSGGLQRLLGYGTITVLTADDTTPEVHLVRISRPTKVKEMIRTQYRAARQREGVHPTEFMKSP